ncbi:MAG: HAMP domain-containing histidine kinase [Patescibacteria group bacterium]|nr:HAMP domain-containing histidine kinase [Patescibacteria group bacterium]MDE1946066.1 HAMP domain-containing histidine kinase [Patescibacteria group bacterium]
MNSETERFASAAIANAPFGFLIAGPDGAVLSQNRKSEEILGSLIGKNMGSIVSAFDVAGSCRDCLAGQKTIEVKEAAWNGKYLKFFFVPADGSACTVIVEDITEAKTVEKNREQFFMVASHDLRTPLAAIKASAELIMKAYSNDIQNENAKKLIANIDLASVRLIKIVSDFLEAPRLEAGRIAVTKERFDVAETIRKAVGDLAIIATNKGISLSYDAPRDPLPAVFADKEIVEQVIVNLIGNALKFTFQGGVTVSSAADDGMMRVRVTDTGVGIAEQDQQMLFGKFRQTDENFIGRGITQGSGLGLYISELLVGMIGGSVVLEKSDLGKGSTFVFAIPLAK